MASTSEEGTHWAQVIFTYDSRPPVLIDKEQITLGRKEDCDISFPGCKFVSGLHCTITRDPGGTFWLQDFSTNGSSLNGEKIEKEKKTKLNHNDQVHMVQQKDHPENDTAFVFQDLMVLNKEAETVYNTMGCDENTQEYVWEEENVKSRKRSHSEAGQTDKGPESKRKRRESEEGAPSGTKPVGLPQNPIAVTLLCSICLDIFYKCVSLQPCIHSFCAACYSQWMVQSNECPICHETVERTSPNFTINNTVEAFLKEHPERCRDEEELREMDSKDTITVDVPEPNDDDSSANDEGSWCPIY